MLPYTYYDMEYESFLPVIQAAVEQGCMILNEYENKVIETKDTSIITNGDWGRFYFYLPEAGGIKFKTIELVKGGKKEIVDTFSCNSVIEAGFSIILADEKRILRNRLYVQSGYYNDVDEWIPRPDCLTKLYNSLARKVKKIAPYTELVDILTYTHGEHYGEKHEWKCSFAR